MEMHWMNDLIARTLRDDETLDDLRHAGLAAFLYALAHLMTAGFTAAQLQWFIGVPFRRFGDEERVKVQLLAMALERGTECVEDWQFRLFNAEFWSRLHDGSRFFPPDPLPDLAAICRDAGLPETFAPVRFPPPGGKTPPLRRFPRHPRLPAF